MVRAIVFLAAWTGAALAGEPPTIVTEGPEVAFVSPTESLKFVAKGGRTDPPATFGAAPWFRTGRCLYTWHLDVTEPVKGGLENPHPLNGTVTASNVLFVPRDKPGSYTVSVRMQEEWQDCGYPQLVLFWPWPDGVPLPPSAPPAPAPWCPALPLVPPAPPEK